MKRIPPIVIESQFDILRRSAERGLNLALEKDIEFVDIFQHMLDEIDRGNTWFLQYSEQQRSVGNH